MTDDEAAALRAAAEASHAAAMTQDVCDASPEAELPIVAAAIAAFLRALPVSAYEANFPDDLAAAVERAAREARDE